MFMPISSAKIGGQNGAVRWYLMNNTPSSLISISSTRCISVIGRPISGSTTFSSSFVTSSTVTILFSLTEMGMIFIYAFVSSGPASDRRIQNMPIDHSTLYLEVMRSTRVEYDVGHV